MAPISEVCTLVWPILRLPDGQLSPSPDGGVWIVGWNPKGLSVIVTALLPHMPFDEAREKLESLRTVLKDRATPRGVPSYRELTLLGYVRGAGSASPSSSCNLPSASPVSTAVGASPTSPFHMSEPTPTLRIKQMRSGNIWLELQDGPVLGEVWCCGYRVQPCQLHVIRCDPKKRYTIKPTVFSVCALYGPAGVKQLKAGKAPVCVPGVESNIEGVLLPDVMLKESAPRTGPARHAPEEVLQTVGGYGSSTTSYSAHRRSTTYTSQSHPAAAQHRTSFSLDENASLSEPDGDSRVFTFQTAIPGSFGDEGLTDTAAQFPGYEDDNEDAGSPLAPRPGVPPRLDFKTSADSAEMSTLLSMVRHGYIVQLAVQGTQSPQKTGTALKAATDTPSSSMQNTSPGWGLHPVATGTQSATSVLQAAETLDARSHWTVDPYVHWLLSALISVLRLPLRVTAVLGRFFWFMEILEHRLREIINLLALLDNRTESCGLHPAVPHHTTDSVQGKVFCCVSCVCRLSTDVVLGIIITVVLRACGPRMYTGAQHISRFFLYDTHMAYMDWFDGWPAGLKVNEDLNQALCFLGKVVLRLWDLVMRFGMYFVARMSGSTGTILSNKGPSAGADGEHDAFGSTEYFWIGPSYEILLPVSYLGASCSFALVADLTGLVSLHLRFLYHAMSLPYRFASALLSSLSSQFRGKKYNPLRRRTDAYEFTVDQMLMATLVFTIVVFLFPTVAVYYFYFAFVRTTVWFAQESLVAAAHLMLYVPVHAFFARTVLGDTLSGGVALSEPIVTMARTGPEPSAAAAASSVGSQSATVEMTAVPLPMSLAPFFADFAYVLGVLGKSLTPNRVLAFIVSGRMGRPSRLAADLIPHLLVNCIDPPCTVCIPPGYPTAALQSATAAAASVPSPALSPSAVKRGRLSQDGSRGKADSTGYPSGSTTPAASVVKAAKKMN